MIDPCMLLCFVVNTEYQFPETNNNNLYSFYWIASQEFLRNNISFYLLFPPGEIFLFHINILAFNDPSARFICRFQRVYCALFSFSCSQRERTPDSRRQKRYKTHISFFLSSRFWMKQQNCLIFETSRYQLKSFQAWTNLNFKIIWWTFQWDFFFSISRADS